MKILFAMLALASFWKAECIETGWSVWSEWTLVSKEEIVPGTMKLTFFRSRKCDDKVKGFRGLFCLGSSMETKTLTRSDGRLSEWSEWSLTREVVIRNGTTELTFTRTRTCNNPLPFNGGKDCEGAKIDEKKVLSYDGGWTNWSEWSLTGENQIGRGVAELTFSKTRTCDNPPPSNGGKDCEGLANKTKIELRLDGSWSDWSIWSLTEKNTKQGIELLTFTRTRKCNDPSPSFGGRNCEGPPNENKTEEGIVVAGVHGGWSEWSDWSDASNVLKPKSSKSSQSRTRNCNSPHPTNGGKVCDGPDTEVKDEDSFISKIISKFYAMLKEFYQRIRE